MQFYKFATVAALAVGSQAAVTAEQMVSNIDSITSKSSQTNQMAQSISLTNFFTTAPQLINGFRDIVELVSNDITAMGASNKAKRQECLNVEDVQKCIEDLEEILEDPSEILGDKKKREYVGSGAAHAVAARQAAAPMYDEAQQQAICSSFRGFVQVHQQLLATVIGKHGLLSLTPFTQPIAAVLRVVEGGVDTLAFGIIDTVPTCAQSSMESKNSLDRSLEDAVNEYSS